MKKKYVVGLTRQQRGELEKMVSSGIGSARKLTRARILLEADCGEGEPGRGDLEISRALGVGTATVYRVRKRFREKGLEAALSRRPSRRAYERKLDAHAEAQLVDLVNQHVPAGHHRWTLRLLAERLTATGPAAEG